MGGVIKLLTEDYLIGFREQTLKYADVNEKISDVQISLSDTKCFNDTRTIEYSILESKLNTFFYKQKEIYLDNILNWQYPVFERIEFNYTCSIKVPNNEDWLDLYVYFGEKIPYMVAYQFSHTQLPKVTISGGIPGHTYEFNNNQPVYLYETYGYLNLQVRDSNYNKSLTGESTIDITITLTY